MNAPVRPFSALVSVMAAPSRASAPRAAPSHRQAAPWPQPKVSNRARNPMCRDLDVIGRDEPLGTATGHQRIEAGVSVATYYAAKESRGEYGSYDDVRRSGLPHWRRR